MKQYVFSAETLSYIIERLKEKFATKQELDTKVDKVEGKTLSTNDYSDEYVQKNNGSFNDVVVSNQTDTEMELTFKSGSKNHVITIPYDKYKKSALFVYCPETFVCGSDEEFRIDYEYISTLRTGTHTLVVEKVRENEVIEEEIGYEYESIPDYYSYQPDKNDKEVVIYFVDSEGTKTGKFYIKPNVQNIVTIYTVKSESDLFIPKFESGYNATNCVTNDVQNEDGSITRTVITEGNYPTYIQFANNQNITSVNKITNKITSMSNTFNNCTNLTGSPICGPNVTSMAYTYSNCTNLTGSPVCGPKVTNMLYTYQNCTNLTGQPVCGSKVANMVNTYCRCYNLTGSPMCGDRVTNMSGAYYSCYNLTGSPVCGSKVINMQNAYWNCTNLTGSPVCGPSVTNMNNTYYNCRNLTGNPVCGNLVTGMENAYRNCCNLTGIAIVGPNVVEVYNTYRDCPNIGPNAYFFTNKLYSAVDCFVGKNNSNRLNIYAPRLGCNSRYNTLTELLRNDVSTSGSTKYYYTLVNAAITWTNNVNTNGYYYNTYHNIYIYPVDNVQQTYYENELGIFITYTTIDTTMRPGITGLTGGYAAEVNGNQVTLYKNNRSDVVSHIDFEFSEVANVSFMTNDISSMHSSFEECHRLTGQPICGPNVTNMSWAYYQCSGLTGYPVCGNKVIDMSYAYRGCTNLTGSPVCGPNVTNMYRTYYYCQNLTGSPVCGDKVTDMSTAYEFCINLTGTPVCGPNVTNMANTYAYCSNLYGDMIVLSNNISNATNCFYGRDNSRRLNIWLNHFTESDKSVLTFSNSNASSSITGTNISWDYHNDCSSIGGYCTYYDSVSNICLYMPFVGAAHGSGGSDE